MGFHKCPRCEVNYITDSETICSVCRREASGEAEQEEMIEICSQCGINPVVPGKELCAECLKESQLDSDDGKEDAPITQQTTSVGIESVSSMEEFVIIPDDDPMDPAFRDDDMEDKKDEDSDEEEGEEEEEDPFA